MKIYAFLVLGLLSVLLLSASSEATDTGDLMICAKYPDITGLCANDNVSLPEKPPVDYIISGLDYNAVVKDKAASITAAYDINILKDGWVKVPLISSDVVVSEVRLDGKVTSLLVEEGWHKLITNEIGEHRLEIVFLSKVSAEVNSYSLKFNIPRVSVSHLWIEIPKMNISVSVASSLDTQTSQGNGKTYVSADLMSADFLLVKWSRKIIIPEPETLEPRLYAEVFTLVSVGEGIVNADTTIQYSIVQAGTAQFIISVPDDVDVLSVAGNNVRNWRLEEDKGQKILNVYLNSEATGTYQLNVRYEKTLQSTSAVSEIPRIQVLDVEREKGYIGVEARTNVEIAVTDVSNANRIDVKELPHQITRKTSRPLLMAYKYLKHPYTIIIDVRKHEEIAVLSAAIDSASFNTLVIGDGKSITKGTYYVKNNRKQFLELDLPPNSKVWSTFVSGKPVKPAKNKEGMILIPLSKSVGGSNSQVSFPVEIVYITEAKGMGYLGSSTFKLPKTDIPISQANLILYLPEEYNFLRFDGNMKESVSGRQYGFPGTLAPSIGYGGVSSKVASNVMMEDQVADAEEFRGNVLTALEKGVLPVQINVPRQGKLYHFNKLMVTEDQQPFIEAVYINSGIYFWFNLMVFAGTLFVGLKAIGELMKAANIMKWIKQKTLFIVLAVALAVVVEYMSPPTFRSMLTAALITLVAGFTYFIYKKIMGIDATRRERKSSESRLKGEIEAD